MTPKQRQEDLTKSAARLRGAKTVLVVGGGPVGVELAAEIVGKYGTEKDVTLVSSKERCVVSEAVLHECCCHCSQRITLKGHSYHAFIV